MHGNLRLGQPHLKAGPAVSTTAWYGVPPLPAHNPHTAVPEDPVPDQRAAVASAVPALRDDASGASARTWSAVHRSARCPSIPSMATTLRAGTDKPP